MAIIWAIIELHLLDVSSERSFLSGPKHDPSKKIATIAVTKYPKKLEAPVKSKKRLAGIPQNWHFFSFPEIIALHPLHLIFPTPTPSLSYTLGM
ncbi:hypothetical protein DENIT_80254 [Pseudomonas veronii]|nr:hypothetical protein DENIT_80254 [Pseudomonas veronii]